MAHKVSDVLTVLATGLLCTVAGYELAADRVKGAAAGAIAGTAVAAAHVHHARRYRQLATAQARLSSRLQQTAGSNPALPPAASEHEQIRDQIQQLKAALSPLTQTTAQTKLNVKQINRLRGRVDELTARLDWDIAAGAPTRSRFRDSDLERDGAIANGTDPSAASPEASPEPMRLGADIPPQFAAAPEIVTWLWQRRVEVKHCYVPDPKIDEMLDGLSFYLGTHYATLNSFHWRLRTNAGQKAYFPLDKLDQRSRNIHQRYLEQLSESDFLSLAQVVRAKDKPDFILATSHNRHDVQGFLNGGWFERYAYSKTARFLAEEGIEYQALRNVKVVYLDSGQSAEFDLVFMIDGHPLLIECKSGKNYSEKIAVFQQHKIQLGLEAGNALFVVFDIDDAQAHIRSVNWGITVTDHRSFTDSMRAWLIESGILEAEETDGTEADMMPSADTGDAADGTKNTEADLFSFLKRKQFNSTAQSRAVVFDGLIQFQGALAETPLIFNQMTKVLRDRLATAGTSLSRKDINGIANSLRHAGIFHDADGQPVAGIKVPVAKLAVDQPDVLEATCMEVYASQILQEYDPHFFDQVENVREFERLVQGQAPRHVINIEKIEDVT